MVASGGLDGQADRDSVAKNLNLALKTTAGQKIYIPRIGETNIQASSLNSQVLGSTAATNLININLASETDLDSLFGIGPVTAAKIINYRPYSNINELLDKKLFHKNCLMKLKIK